MKIRPATAADSAAICAIYNHYILTTTISFEEQALTPEQMSERIADSGGLPWLVLEQYGVILGYAYASKWRVRAAYRFAVEASVYLDPTAHGKKLGGLLYQTLIDQLRQREVHTIIGGIAQPNPASVGLHEKLGFVKVAHFAQVGFKHGQWIDVGYWQLLL